MKNYVRILLFFAALAPQLASASLFSPRKSTNPSDAFTVAEARKIVATWRGRVSSANGNGDKVTASMDAIRKDRQIIKAALKQHLDGDLKKSLDQIRILLNLAEIRAIISEASKAKQSFGSVFSNYTQRGNRDDTQRSGGRYGKSWYGTMIRRLASLLKEFDAFTGRYPTILSNPPELLVGIDQTLRQARETGKELQQYESCFDKPDQPYCTSLASRSGSRGGGFGGQFDDEFGSDGYEEDFESDFY